MKPFSVKSFFSALLLILAISGSGYISGHGKSSKVRSVSHSHSHFSEGRSSIQFMVFVNEETNNNDEDETGAKKVCSRILHSAGLQPEAQLTFLYSIGSNPLFLSGQTPIFIRNGVFRI